MNRVRVRWVLRLGFCVLALFPMTFGHADDARTVNWSRLIPPGWAPKPIDYKRFFSAMANGDPAVVQEEDAPVVLSLNKQHIRIPGYLVIASWDTDPVPDVFLVPYFGSCIHTPPPPSNQVVLVHLQKPMKREEIFDHGPVWVTGTIRTDGGKTDIASAGYSMTAERVDDYDEDTYRDKEWFD